MGYSDRLKKAGKTFKTAKQRAKEEGNFGAELPDGRYLTELESCELCEAQSDGHLQVAMIYKVIEGESKGETIRKYLAVEGEDNQVWLHRELLRFGIQLDSLEELEKVVAILNKSKAEVKMVLKTKDSGQFSYVNKVTSEIDTGDFATDGEDQEEQEEEDEEEGDESELTSDKSNDVEESEEEETDEDEGTIEVGMTVGFESKAGGEVVGEVKEILEKTEEVKVKTTAGKVFTIKAERLYVPEDSSQEEEEEEAEEEEVPVKKAVVKKPAPKIAAKKTIAKKTAKKR